MGIYNIEKSNTFSLILFHREQMLFQKHTEVYTIVMMSFNIKSTLSENY